MPEWLLTGLQTETLMRDLSPFQTTIYGVPHGATTHPAGAPTPANWVTEDGMSVGEAEQNGMPAADVPEFQAKASLRLYAAWGGEGAQAIDLYAATGGGCCQLISQGFFNAVDANPAYPGRRSGRSDDAGHQPDDRDDGRRPADLVATSTVAERHLQRHQRVAIRRQRHRRLPAALQPRRADLLPLPGQPEQDS